MEVKLFRMPREENLKVDMIAKLAASITAEMPMDILVETVRFLYTERIAVSIFEKRKDWRIPSLEYFKKETLPTNLKETKKVIR